MWKNVLIQVIFILLSLLVRGQFVLLDSVYKLNNYTSEFTYSSVQLSEDKFVLTGYAANTHYWINLFCISTSGDTIWNVQFNIDSLGVPTVNQATIDEQKNILLACTLNNANVHGREAMLIKTDSSGNLKWLKHYPIYIPYNSQYIGLFGLVPSVTFDHKYLLSCNYGNDTGVVNIMAIKVDSNGNEIARWNYPTPYYDWIWCSKQTSDSGFLFAGESNRRFPLYLFFGSIYILKTDQYGLKQWDTTYPSLFTDSLLLGNANVRDLIEVNDGYILAGTKAYASNYHYNQSGPRGWEKCWIGKISKTDGHLIWEHYYGIDSADASLFYGLIQTDDLGYILVGGYNFNNNTEGKAWVLKTDANGDSIWSTIIEHPLDSVHYGDPIELHKIHKIEGGYLITGFRWPDWPVHRQPFPYVITIDNNGCWELGCSATDIREVATNSFNASLMVYPNPTNGDIHIKYSTELNNSGISISIADILGNKVTGYSLQNNAGEIQISQPLLPAGIYFCILKQNNQLLKTARFVKF